MAKKGEGLKTSRALMLEEVQAILKAADGHPRDRALLDVAVHVGLRASDLLRLEWAWVLNAEQTGIGTTLSLVERKTKRVADLPLTTALRRPLAHWWIESGRPTKGLIFPSRKGGGPMTSDGLSLLIRRWGEVAKINVNHLSSHSLRKAFGREWWRSGKPLVHLQQRFGHSSMATTLRYLGITKEEVAASAEAVDFHANGEHVGPRQSPSVDPEHYQGPKNTGNKLPRGATGCPEPSLDSVMALLKEIRHLVHQAHEEIQELKLKESE